MPSLRDDHGSADLASKYLDHLPLYRIEPIVAGQGVPLARSGLVEWVVRIGVALRSPCSRWPTDSLICSGREVACR